MDYNLENKIHLIEESEHKYWSLQEFDEEGKKLGANLTPWQSGYLYFTASELRYNYTIDEHTYPANELERISGILHSGICVDGKYLKDEVSYSMLGTKREMKQFFLNIYKINNDRDKAKFRTCGFIGSTWGGKTTEDMLHMEFYLMPQQFSKIAELIKAQCVDILNICLFQVSGFYSASFKSETDSLLGTWSIKILTVSPDHKVETNEGCTIDPPRLGDIGEFDMTFTQRHKLNPKQDLRGIDIVKLFEEPEDHKEDVREETQESLQTDKSSLALAQLAQNEEFLKKLSTPLWLIFIILCFLLVKVT